MIAQVRNKIVETNSRNSGYLLLIFILWPFIGFIIASYNFRDRISKKIILAFFALYGILYFLNPVMDGQRRADYLKEIFQEPFANLFNTIDNLYTETLDFVEPLIMYSVSRFTDFYGILFAIYALIFGGLMLYYLQKIYRHYVSNKNANAFLFLVLLVCVNPVFNINGFRMWTAAWIFAIGVLNYLHKSHYKHFLFSACAIFVHFSFLPVVAFFGVYIFLKNKPKIYGALAILTFFVAELNIEQVRQYAALLGTASETKITAYSGEEYIETVSELSNQSASYIQLMTNGLKYFTLITLLIIFLKTKGIFKTKITSNFYSFTLLFLSFANISALLPSGGRFYTVFYIFSFSTIILYFVYESREKSMTTINKIGVPLIAMYALFTFRLFSETASAYLLGPSFLMPFGLINNISLQSLLF